MRIVTANELQDWLSQGELLEKDSHGPKVVRLPDGSLLKIFRSRRNPLLARLRPDARRFAERAERLQALGIATPNIRECAWIDRHAAVSACLYAPLAGLPLDKLFRDQRDEFDRRLPQLAAYILKLHRLGIYFRSLHLGNILQLPGGDYGLIDILVLQHKRRPLNRWQIQRNFQHLRRYLKRKQLADFPIEHLLELYQNNQHKP